MAKKQSTVYVIDDDESVRTALARLLRSANFNAETFSSADEFLKNPKQKQDACVLVDIRMPGSTGFDLQRQLVSTRVQLPVIVISASDETLIREHARQLGAVSFFRKPVDDQALLDAILWAIAGARRDTSGDGAR
ncbi:MAG: response regulator transcription factor [Syntrophales bacterium]